MRAPVNLRAVILDVDGTLVDSNDAHARAWVRALADDGRDVPFERVRPLIGMGGDKLLPILTGLNPHEEAGERISERRRRIFANDYLPLLTPQPGSRHLLLMLRERGVRRIVASSAEEGELQQLLHVAGADDLVEHAVSKDEAGRSKPDPDAVHAALRHLGLPADEVLMIGDTPYDIEAAGRMGVATLAFRCGGFSLQELADAVAVYRDPQDLVNDYDASVLGRSGGGPAGQAIRRPA